MLHTSIILLGFHVFHARRIGRPWLVILYNGSSKAVVYIAFYRSCIHTFFCLHNPGARYSLSWPANYPIWWVLREESTKIRTETRKYTPRLSAMKTFGFHKQTPNIFMVQIIFFLLCGFFQCTFCPVWFSCDYKSFPFFKSCTTTRDEINSIRICSHIWKPFKPQFGCFVSDFFGNRPYITLLG